MGDAGTRGRGQSSTVTTSSRTTGRDVINNRQNTVTDADNPATSSSGSSDAAWVGTETADAAVVPAAATLGAADEAGAAGLLPAGCFGPAVWVASGRAAPVGGGLAAAALGVGVGRGWTVTVARMSGCTLQM